MSLGTVGTEPRKLEIAKWQMRVEHRAIDAARADDCAGQVGLRDPRRDLTVLCVVEEPLEVLALERTGEFKGLYHVLHGAISPIDGVGPERLKVRQLFERADEANRAGVRFEEVVIATNPTLEGEATAMYLAERLEPLVGSVTRIARGLPVGGDLEYADEVTLIRALQGRRAMS